MSGRCEVSDVPGWLHVPVTVPGSSARIRVRREIAAVLTRQLDRLLPGKALDDSATASIMVSVDLAVTIAAAATQDALFLATELPARAPVIAGVAVIEPLQENPNYLPAMIGASRSDALGQPMVEPLPPELIDGVSVLRYDELADGRLVGTIVLARRAWAADIVVTLRTTELQVLPFSYQPLCALLGAVQQAEVEVHA